MICSRRWCCWREARNLAFTLVLVDAKSGNLWLSARANQAVALWLSEYFVADLWEKGQRSSEATKRQSKCGRSFALWDNT